MIFVRDRENKWYRVQLNTNCLNGNYEGESAAFRSRDVSGQINKLTEVSFPETGIRCNIDSIRRSAPPPQVDSKSPVTLD